MTRRAQKGFTLLEVIVAFTILALVFGALFEVFAGGLAASSNVEAQSRAILLAQSNLAEISADDSFASGATSGVFDVNAAREYGPSYRWRASFTRYGEDELGPTDRATVVPYTASVEVSWEERGREWRVELQSMVLKSE
jgi:general secretion pathway protein I